MDSRAKKLRHLMAIFSVGLLANCSQVSKQVNSALLSETPPHTITTNLQENLQKFQDGLKSRVTEEERDMLAKLIYGEAGPNPADACEVVHTVFNRVASKYFPNTVAEVITQKNQYAGYNPNHPVLHQNRQLVDLLVWDWEDCDCQEIHECQHYYFVTGIPHINNRFEIGTQTKGIWVPPAEKEYEKLNHYCAIATRQALRYRANKYNLPQFTR